MKKLLMCSVIFIILGINLVNAQTAVTRQLPAIRNSSRIKIDGLLTDSAWRSAAKMDSLVEFRPAIGALEVYAVRTEAFLLYDDDGIYFGGYCYERTKDSIAYELRGRDGFGLNDYIGIILDTYKDHQNGFEYFVTPLNEQWDAKMSPPNDNNGGEDFSWNGVWKSGAVMHKDGWSFEMFIPYSAIRFGKKDIQEWGLNITRRRRKTEQQYTWNPIDPNVNGFLTQEGYWTGISNIKPPIRLSFSPYVSMYANHYPNIDPGQKDLTGQINGGMDIKYGITQAFTLDMTLIPDFGQVQSDNQVLNLSPFEVQYNEYRSFFTEGTELFSKGNLFYSRRIGGTPLHQYDVYDNLAPTEIVKRNPNESKLLNATKISGRTQKGLGIGYLNAVTRPQYAVIEDHTSKQQREYMTDPLTNYNIIVLDQTLKNNSSVSLINTDVLRSGPDYDANVTAALFNFNDKKNMWNLGGKFAMSNLFGYEEKGKTKSGFNHRLYFGKTSGRFNFNVYQEAADTKYTHNDLGYFTNNNFLTHGLFVGYKWTVPKSFYNRIFINFNSYVSHLFTKISPIESKYQNADMSINLNVQMKKLHWFGIYTGYRPVQNDFYEPRTEGYYFQRGASAGLGGWFESNGAKKYSFYVETFARQYFDFYNLFAVDFFLNQTFRINKKLSFNYRFSMMPRFNSVGFATNEKDNILFGKRKVKTYENIFDVKYSFNNMMGLTFRLRHYNSTVDYNTYFTLVQKTGLLEPAPWFTGNANQNANFFNIDMVYTWQFAPGSFVNIVWKNAVSDFNNQVEDNYFANVNNVFSLNQNNNVSIKVIYFLDYLQLKKKKKS